MTTPRAVASLTSEPWLEKGIGLLERQFPDTQAEMFRMVRTSMKDEFVDVRKGLKLLVDTEHDRRLDENVPRDHHRFHPPCFPDSP